MNSEQMAQMLATWREANSRWKSLIPTLTHPSEIPNWYVCYHPNTHSSVEMHGTDQQPHR